MNPSRLFDILEYAINNHPLENALGPNDSNYLFDKFIQLIKN